jgi:hypothetical protein
MAAVTQFYLGPILWLFDVVPENQICGAVFLFILAPCLFLWMVWPRWWTAALAVVVVPVWLFLGIVMEGAGV